MALNVWPCDLLIDMDKYGSQILEPAQQCFFPNSFIFLRKKRNRSSSAPKYAQTLSLLDSLIFKRTI